jgi:lysozyme
MTDMTISTRGLIEIAEHEGIVPAPYLDSVGVWTWGIGHTAAAGGPDPARLTRTMPQDVDAAVMAAIEQFAIDVKGYVARVNDAIRVPIDQHQFDALVSFDFNTGGIHRARLTAAINAGEPDAARHFLGWLKPPEIRKRRTAEMSLFRTGDYAANGDAVPIWRTDGRGKLTGILRTISGEELLRRIAAAPIPEELPQMVDLTPAIAAAARARAAQDAAARALVELEAALAA